MTEADIPRGTYAKGGRSPVVYALLCPTCAGYAPTAEDCPLPAQCQGCGAWVREVHRFQALILSAANGGCMCPNGHPQVTGDLPTGESLGQVYTELATRPMSPVQRSERDEAVDLLERVLHLRMNGERAPGGTETWRDWDRKAEACLRDIARRRVLSRLRAARCELDPEVVRAMGDDELADHLHGAHPEDAAGEKMQA